MLPELLEEQAQVEFDSQEDYDTSFAQGVGQAATVNGATITIKDIQVFPSDSETYCQHICRPGYSLVVLKIFVQNESIYTLFPTWVLIDSAGNTYQTDPADAYGFIRLGPQDIIDPESQAEGYAAFEVPDAPLRDPKLHLEWISEALMAHISIVTDLTPYIAEESFVN